MDSKCQSEVLLMEQLFPTTEEFQEQQGLCGGDYTGAGPPTPHPTIGVEALGANLQFTIQP